MSFVIIGVAGGSGSGKTTFVDKVIQRTSNEISVVHMDSYYLPRQPKSNYTQKGKPNYDHPDAFDWPLLREHLSRLKNGEAINAPIYDFVHSCRSNETESIEPRPVILFEGIFTLYNPDIRELLDITCFLSVDSDIRFARRLNRDIESRGRSMQSVIEQYYETVRPMYQKYLAPQKEFAHFIVGEETDVAADILSAKIATYYQ